MRKAWILPQNKPGTYIVAIRDPGHITQYLGPYKYRWLAKIVMWWHNGADIKYDN